MSAAHIAAQAEPHVAAREDTIPATELKQAQNAIRAVVHSGQDRAPGPALMAVVTLLDRLFSQRLKPIDH
jgi:hypothetical protein